MVLVSKTWEGRQVLRETLASSFIGHWDEQSLETEEAD